MVILVSSVETNGGEAMSNIDSKVSADEARAALAAVGEANRIVASSMRPPLWLILLCSVALGVKTVAMGLMISDILWSGVQWGSYIVVCLSVVLWIVALRAKGIAIRVIDVNITRAAVASAVFICMLIVLSRVMYLQTSGVLFPVIAGALNTLILAFGLHFGLRLNAKGAANNNA
jgi:hypothetical protein